VFVLVSTVVLDERGRARFVPNPPPLYQKSTGAKPLTTYERRSCASAILIATGSDQFYPLTTVADGVRFDIDGDGNAEQVSWTHPSASVAFLAVDRDGDGAITSGKELFGRHTWPGAPNGYAALADMAIDSNGGVARGSVSENDPLFARLLLWTDDNHDGVSQKPELRLVGDFLSDIGLGYRGESGRDPVGNLFLYEGWAYLRTAQGRNDVSDREDDLRRRRRNYAVCFARSMS
jgi:hypothetical protein